MQKTLFTNRSMMKVLFFIAAFLSYATLHAQIKFSVTFPKSLENQALDGRLLLMLTTDSTSEPRYQIRDEVTTAQVFGIDVENWQPDKPATIDASVLGYPIRSLSGLKAGRYYVQALLHRYETFKLKDGRV